MAVPTLTHFVAPAYPRSAKVQRIMGRTTTRLTIGREGLVQEAKTILAHPEFESYVLKALKEWRFTPSDREYSLEVTCYFELGADCEGTANSPTGETFVSADLPTIVHISARGGTRQRSV